MTLIAVSIPIDSPDDAAGAAPRVVRAAERGADIVEWRIDALADELAVDETAAIVQRLVAESPLPSIVTCRAAFEGGQYTGGEDERVSLYEAICTGEHPPRYIDVELATYRRSANVRQKVDLAVQHPGQVREVRARLILSSHDFDDRPADLLRRIASMVDEPACAVAKIAWRARSLRDNLEAFELLRHRSKPLVALCMGEFGLMSRVLASKFGAMLTFTCEDRLHATAPGQPTVEELTQLYRVRRVKPSTRVYGVIGWPVRQSRGPLVHNALFDRVQHDGVYVPMPIAPGWEPFKATLDAMLEARWLGFRGASVTLPHKEHLLRFVRERGGVVEEEAARIGAANTLVVSSDGSLTCLNTDAPAAVGSLVEEGGLDRDTLASTRVAVIGAGGAARAVARAVSALGATVVIFNRDEARAAALADALNGAPTGAGRPAKVVTGRLDSLGCGCFPVVINCTPVGMTGGPAPDESPLPDDMPLDAHVTIFDTVHNPAVTPMLAIARERGARVVDGVGMFLRQAALQAAAWIDGVSAESALAIMREALAAGEPGQATPAPPGDGENEP